VVAEAGFPPAHERSARMKSILRNSGRWKRGAGVRSGRYVGTPAWLRLHDLRHVCATFLLLSGASPGAVMDTLGHSQIGSTMNTYAHVPPRSSARLLTRRGPRTEQEWRTANAE
jgi:integrase